MVSRDADHVGNSGRARAPFSVKCVTVRTWTATHPAPGGVILSEMLDEILTLPIILWNGLAAPIQVMCHARGCRDRDRGPERDRVLMRRGC